MSRRDTALLAAVFFLLALAVYRPALEGPPISDDLLLLAPPELRTLRPGTLWAVLDPTGPVSRTYTNWSPVHALLDAAELQAFGEHWLGYHLVNVAFHALTSALLAAFFLETGIPFAAALLGAAVFLLHPANVEAVAWMSQIKTTAAATFALLALLQQRRRPALGTTFFALALLTKAHAALALPVLAVLELARGARHGSAGAHAEETAPRWRWVAIWALLFAGFCALEIPLFREIGEVPKDPFAGDLFAHARFVVAIAARYLVMAATGLGLSTMHAPRLTTPLSDLWWLAGLVALSLLGLRLLVTLQQRRVEAAYWVWAASAFAPVSQVLPFVYPLGDRYLYFILPGLLGGALLVARDLLASLGGAATRRRVGYAVGVGVVALALAFAARASQRARVWRSQDAYAVDAAIHYPDAVNALMLRARARARAGDAEGTVAALRTAHERGWTRYGYVFYDPSFAPVRSDPRFQALMREITQDWLDRMRAAPSPDAAALESQARLHVWRGERREAIATLERAIALGGPGVERLRAELRELSRQEARVDGAATHAR